MKYLAGIFLLAEVLASPNRVKRQSDVLVTNPGNATANATSPGAGQIITDSLVIEVVQINNINSDDANGDDQTINGVVTDVPNPMAWNSTAMPNTTDMIMASTSEMTMYETTEMLTTDFNLFNSTATPACNLCLAEKIQPCKCQGTCYRNSCLVQNDCSVGIIPVTECKKYLMNCDADGC